MIRSCMKHVLRVSGAGPHGNPTSKGTALAVHVAPDQPRGARETAFAHAASVFLLPVSIAAVWGQSLRYKFSSWYIVVRFSKTQCIRYVNRGHPSSENKALAEHTASAKKAPDKQSLRRQAGVSVLYRLLSAWELTAWRHQSFDNLKGKLRT